MNTTTELIVLNTTKVGDNAIVLHSLSKEYGRRSFIVKGIGKKSVMAYFQPLNILEADVVESARTTLFQARSIVSRHPLNGLRSNMYKNAMTMFMAEVLFRLLREGGREENLYEMCVNEILLLDALEADFSNFHIRFLLRLAVAMGFSPSPEDLAPFLGMHLKVVERFMNESFEYSMLIPLTGLSRNEIAEGLLRYLEFHVESSVSVKSLKVLHELFI